MDDSPKLDMGTASQVDTNNVSPEQWRLMYLQLAAEQDRLQRDLEKVRKERDDYLKAVHALLPRKEFQFTREELFAHQGAEPTVDQLLFSGAGIGSATKK
jgi:hypothetical protein